MGIRLNWTIADIEKKVAEGKIRGYVVMDDGRKLQERLSGEETNRKKGRSKYGSKKVAYDGLKFDSKKEAKRYQELLIMLKAGLIGQLKLQVKYLLTEGVSEEVLGKKRVVERKTEYWADFVYIDAVTGETIVEDVKSEATRKKESYIIKRKLMLEKHGIRIKEV